MENPPSVVYFDIYYPHLMILRMKTVWHCDNYSKTKILIKDVRVLIENVTADL